jgi:hypothetical protein
VTTGGGETPTRLRSDYNKAAGRGSKIGGESGKSNMTKSNTLVAIYRQSSSNNNINSGSERRNSSLGNNEENSI